MRNISTSGKKSLQIIKRNFARDENIYFPEHQNRKFREHPELPVITRAELVFTHRRINEKKNCVLQVIC